MPRFRPASLATAGLLCLTLFASACSSKGTTTTLGNASSTVPDNAADPNGAEVNPPGDIPDDQVFVAYTPPSGAFHVEVPEGWARTQEGDAVVFSDKLNSIRMETVPADSPPTPASATATEVPAIAAATANYEPGSVDAVPRRSGEVVRITYRGDSAPDPVTGKIIHLDVERYEFYQDGTEAILTLSGPQGADNVDPWRRVTDSLAWS